MSTTVIHAIHEFDHKIGTVEEVDDRTAARLIATGLAREATDEEIQADTDRAAREAKEADQAALEALAGLADDDTAPVDDDDEITSAPDASVAPDTDTTAPAETPAPGFNPKPSDSWPKPRLVARAVEAGVDEDTASGMTKRELAEAILHREAVAAATPAVDDDPADGADGASSAAGQD